MGARDPSPGSYRGDRVIRGEGVSPTILEEAEGGGSSGHCRVCPGVGGSSGGPGRACALRLRLRQPPPLSPLPSLPPPPQSAAARAAAAVTLASFVAAACANTAPGGSGT